MRFLLDTSTLVPLLRRRNHARIEQRLRSVEKRQATICSVVRLELMDGAFRQPDPSAAVQILQEFLAEFVSHAFDDAAADHAARIRSALSAKGTPIGPYDLQIAGTALRHGLVLVTCNVSEFSRVPGLIIEDWSNA